MGKLFRSFQKGRASLNYFRDHEYDSRIYTFSTFTRWICEIREWSINFFKKAIIEHSLLKDVRIFNEKEFRGFQIELENYIIEEILFSDYYNEFGSSLSSKSSDVSLYRSRIKFTIDVFYIIYKSLSNIDKKNFAINNIKSKFIKLLESQKEILGIPLDLL